MTGRNERPLLLKSGLPPLCRNLVDGMPCFPCAARARKDRAVAWFYRVLCEPLP